MDFNFELSLKRLAEVAVATLLWDNEAIRQKTKEYFYKHDKLKEEYEWDKITESVYQLLDPAMLPQPLYFEMIYVIRNIGMKICDWYHSMKSMNLFFDTDRKAVYDKFMRKIYWTHYGSIDGYKTFKLSWMNNPDIDPVIVYSMACLYCLEDKIPTLWKKIPRKERRRIELMSREFQTKSGFFILRYWLAWNGDSFALERFNRSITVDGNGEFLNENYSPEANMFLISARKGYRKAVEYFWENISPYEQKKTLPIALNYSMGIIGSRSWLKQYHRKEQFIETSIFLLRKLDRNCVEKLIKYEKKIVPLFETESKVVSRNADNFINIFLNIWPWPELFMTAFNIAKPYFKHENYFKLLNVISTCMHEDNSLKSSVKISLYRRMFQAVWEEIPSHMKNSYDDYHMMLTFWYFEWDATIIKMVLNDPSVDDIRDDLIYQMLHYMIDGLTKNEMEKVDEFLDEVFADVSIVEMKIYKFIFQNDFESLENFEQSYEKPEFTKIKSKLKITSEGLVRFFLIKKEFDAADKFLNWRFDEENEIDKLKCEVREHYSTTDYIFQIWMNHNEEEAKEKSEIFIRWFVNSSDGVDSFKKETVIPKLKNSNFEERDMCRFYDAAHYEMLIPFLQWTGIDQPYIKKFQTVVKRDFPIPDYMENNRIEKAENFLNWAFSTEDEKTEYLFNFINSKEGIWSCEQSISNIIKDNAIQDLPEIFEKFINFWIKPTGSGNRIKSKLTLWKEKLEKLNNEINDFTEEKFDPWSGHFAVREDSEKSFNFNGNEIYCPEEKLSLFLKVLDSMTSGDDQNKADNYESDDSTDMNSESSEGTGSSYDCDFLIDDDDFDDNLDDDDDDEWEDQEESEELD